MLVGRSPFYSYGTDQVSLFKRIVQVKYSFPPLRYRRSVKHLDVLVDPNGHKYTSERVYLVSQLPAEVPLCKVGKGISD